MAASLFDNIDETDPCQVWPVLEKIRLRILAGEMVTTARFGTDEKTWQKSDLEALKGEIARLKGECIVRSGGNRPRYAKRMQFSPY
ncbi:hypothetical protein [Aurantimonas phage AmM-1]|uniref:hypothetical protein n=1 Tax=Aurantimonas phage AmM-1 TaxID=1503929 RepID=UPI000540EE26|nr:hypothetical protein ACQ23_gp04 [Aurantimonas phage AmM-1]BAP94461.1 hypothetical protein [Aurantimonas phage AmM-1]